MHVDTDKKKRTHEQRLDRGSNVNIRIFQVPTDQVLAYILVYHNSTVISLVLEF